MIVLDTTVLVYALGTDHALRDPCRRLIEAVAAGEVVATTTTEVIQEFAHVRARRRNREDAVALAQAYADILTPLLSVDEAHVRAGLTLFERHPGLGAFDAVLAATSALSGAEVLVSADRAFSAIDLPRHVLPDAEGVERLLHS